MSSRTLEILNQLKSVQSSPYVFPGQRENRPLSNMTFEMLMRRMEVRDATPHGFRSSFRDWAGNETAFPRELAEAALSHIVGNAVDAIQLACTSHPPTSAYLSSGLIDFVAAQPLV